MTLRFLILGPFEVHVDGQPLALGGRQQRALLAALTLRANELVSSERLIDELWPEDPPDTADHLVHVYVSRLRKALGEEGRRVLVTRPPGYQLSLDRGDLDLHRFEDLIASAKRSTDEGRFSDASDQLEQALSVWRGPALSDLASEYFARADAERLNEQHLSATEDLMFNELGAGRSDMVPELRALVAQHPLRERLRGYLMIALYREGRQAEALQSYEAARAVLADELGIDPSTELQDLHRRVLMQDATLHAPAEEAAPRDPGAEAATRSVGTDRRRRRGWLVALVVTASVAVSAVAIPRLVGKSKRTDGAPVPGIARLSAAGDTIAERLDVGGHPSAMAVDGSIVWLADRRAKTVTRVDTARDRSIPVGSTGIPQAIVAAKDAAWVLDPFGGTVTRIDEAGRETVIKRLAAPVDAVYASDSLWVLEAINERVFRLDPLTGRTLATIELVPNTGPIGIDAGPSSIWVLNSLDHSLSRIDPSSDRLDPNVIPLFCGADEARCLPTDLSVSGDMIWVTLRQGLVERFGSDGSLQQTTTGVAAPVGIAADPRGSWVLSGDPATLIRLTLAGDIVETLRTQPPAMCITSDGDTTWAAMDSP